MKTSIYMDIDSSPNESVLCESILNMIDDCQILKIFILRILSGEPIQNIFDELKNK